MGNHNVQITNPDGQKRLYFEENATRDICEEVYKHLCPIAKGWNVQIVNLNRKNHQLKPDYILVIGKDKDGNFISTTKAGHKTNFGWYTVKMAKRDLRKQGASYFTTEKVWEDGEGEQSPGRT